MMNALSLFARSRFYWLLVIVACLLMEGCALYYQYVLEYDPCSLCVQVRAWIAGLGAVAVLGFLFGKHIAALGHLLSLGLGAGFIHTSWILFQVEKGNVDAACSLEPPFPDWLPLGDWLPRIFEPWQPCGQTPELLFGITMADALIVVSIVWVVISFFMFIFSLRRQRPAITW